jgi:hypothetical protein
MLHVTRDKKYLAELVIKSLKYHNLSSLLPMTLSNRIPFKLLISSSLNAKTPMVVNRKSPTSLLLITQTTHSLRIGTLLGMKLPTTRTLSNYNLVIDAHYFLLRMTHVGQPSSDEIDGNIIALNALAGIPLTAIRGFRAPYLNFSTDTLTMLQQAEFTYDSSTASSIPVNDTGTDAYWPYTLDYGLANDCLTVPNICQGQPVLPGFWEIPMYAFFDELGVNGPHLMDPWL